MSSENTTVHSYLYFDIFMLLLISGLHLISLIKKCLHFPTQRLVFLLIIWIFLPSIQLYFAVLFRRPHFYCIARLDNSSYLVEFKLTQCKTNGLYSSFSMLATALLKYILILNSIIQRS